VLAGTVGTRGRNFLLFDAIGAAIWSGSAVYLGSLFSTAVDELLDVLVNLGISETRWRIARRAAGSAARWLRKGAG